MKLRHDPHAGLDVAALEPGMAAPVGIFFEWLERQEAIHEYDRGVIGMMVRVKRNHSRLVSRFVQLLGGRLQPEAYDVHAEAFPVHAGGSVRFPDVVVERAAGDGASLQAEAPLVIVEVTSRSSLDLDMVVKRDEYLTLPSLKAYVVASQDAPSIAIWRRGDHGGFPAEAEQIEGFGSVLELQEPQISLPLSELYGFIR